MPIVQVRVEGVALWLERDSFWEVLFPRRPAGAPADIQHIPLLTILADGRTIVPTCSLEDLSLDLSHLWTSNATVQKPGWMLELKPAATAAVRRPNAATQNAVFASVTVPLESISPTSDRLIGPVSFDGQRDLYLDHGTLLHGDSPHAPVVPVVRVRETGIEVGRLSLPVNAKVVTLVIQNRTEKEHGNLRLPMRHGDPVEDVADLLTLCESSSALPRYEGPDLVPVTATAATVATSAATVPSRPWVDEYRLCPHCVVMK